ncbi:hypothetical protein EDB89DRAFT_2067639 [Lactarius sanguifluus]|nr:hypothetical protein EDB89DRAFT_2067639 [Lactarius sanguifluus]
MATITPDPPSPLAGLVEPSAESIKVLFDYPDADVVLRSRDSQTFRVLKLYIINSSSVLGELIKVQSDTPDTADSESTQTQLPEVHLPVSSAILSSLLTFIFPVNTVLPSTLEENMELLSVAHKYEMSSVLSYIRGSLALQDPPFITPENAFLAYSLAQRYGLYKEATQAARLTLKFVLTIETLEDKLAMMPGAYLHELWKYHQRVQAHFKSDLPSSGAGAVLKDVNCSRTQGADTPRWLELYIQSIIENPSRFDPIEFQMALARHTSTGGNGPRLRRCSCVLIPVEKMRAFWTTLAATAHRCMEKADSELSILGTEANQRSHMGPPAVSLPLPEYLDLSEADIIVRTPDLTTFRSHKAVLASSSSVLRNMLSLPQPPNSEMIDGLPVVDISEDAVLVRSLITILYHIPSDLPASYDRILVLLAAAQKYDMVTVQSYIRAEIACRLPPTRDEAVAFRIYAIASSSGLTSEMEIAALLTLDEPMTFEHLGDQLRLFEGPALRELSRFRKSCRDNLVSCFEYFLDIDSGPSTIWLDCPRRVSPAASVSVDQPSAQPQNPRPTLPRWVHSIITSQIEELKQAFTRPLIKYSIICEKYLEALRKHAAPDCCTFCLGVHAMKGEWYCAQLKQSLFQARKKACTPFAFRGYPLSLTTPRHRAFLKTPVVSADMDSTVACS